MTDTSVVIEEKLTDEVIEKLLNEKSKDDGKEEKKYGSSVFVYLCAIPASLMSFGLASGAVWTSPVIAKLKSADPDINPLGNPITTLQESLIGGLPFIGAVFGCLCLAKLPDFLGRLRTMLILGILQLAANLLLAYSTTVYFYCISRFIIGIGMGTGAATLGIYLSEICEDHNRGRIGSLIGLSFPLGNLYVYVLGPLFSVRTFTILCSFPFVLLTIALITFMPETPIYLTSKGKRDKAIKSLEKFRTKNSEEIEKEYQTIVRTLNKTGNQQAGLGEFFKTKALRRVLLINIMGNSILMFSGVSAITVFAGPLFDAAKTGVTGNTVAILMGLVKFASVFLATVTVEKLGKRPLLLISTMGVACSHLVLGLFFYLRTVDSPLVNYILWLPVVSILVYFIFYGVGIGAVIPSLTAEISPTHVKSIATSIGSFFIFFLGGLVSLIFPFFIRTLGPAWCFWSFSFLCIVGFLFIYFYIPEIKGKSIIEIQELLSK